MTRRSCVDPCAAKNPPAYCGGRQIHRLSLATSPSGLLPPSTQRPPFAQSASTPHSSSAVVHVRLGPEKISIITHINSPPHSESRAQLVLAQVPNSSPHNEISAHAVKDRACSVRADEASLKVKHRNERPLARALARLGFHEVGHVAPPALHHGMPGQLVALVVRPQLEHRKQVQRLFVEED